jgi:hypothetical protein
MFFFFGFWFEKEEGEWPNSGGRERVLVETDFGHKNR